MGENWIAADGQDSRLRDLLPVPFLRNMLIRSANFDLVSGWRLGAAVSMGPLHGKIIRPRLLRGDAAPVFGARALNLLVPEIGSMGWEDLDAIRKAPGIRDYRAMLRDIEAAAFGSANGEADFQRRVISGYADRLRSTATKLAGTRMGRIRSAALNWVIGLPLNLLPVVGGLASSLPGLARDEIQALSASPQWLSADEALRRAAARKTSRISLRIPASLAVRQSNPALRRAATSALCRASSSW